MNRACVPLRRLAGRAQRFVAAIALVCGAAVLPAAAQTVTTLSTQYTAPKFVAVALDKTVWVTDQSHPLSALTFVNGAYQTPTAFGGSTAEFTSPMGVAVDSGGTVHISNNPAAGQVGFWEALPPNYVSINGLACSCSGTPGGAALDSHGNFFIADSAGALLEITAPGYNGLVTLSAGTHPAAVAFDAEDNLFLTDQLSGSGQILELTASSGYAGSISITSGNLQRPVGIAVDSRGNLYVTDNAANTLTEILAPNYATAVVIDSTHFSAPMGVAIDANDNIFIADTGHNALKLIPSQPAVTGVVPNAGPLGGGNTVTLSGAHLSGATAVSFGGSAALGFTVVSDSQIVATAPARSSGTVDIRVTTPNGTSVAAASDRYAYTAAPAVSGVSSNAGPTAGGNPVTITGSNLSRATSVTFGGVAAVSFTVIGNSLIIAPAPPGAAGSVHVAVTTPGGTSAPSAADTYTYVAAPSIASVSPPIGSTLGGNTVTITGNNLGGTSTVLFGGTSASGFVVVSATQLTATAPAGSVGTVDITVTTAGGASATSAADRYGYRVPSTTSVAGPGTPRVFGQSVTFTATVNGQNPTGSVAFSAGATTLCSAAALIGGGNSPVATCTTTALPTGTDTIAAVYAGNSANLASSGVTSLEIDRAATTLALTVPAGSVHAGSSTPITAVLGVTAPGAGSPTGTIVINDGAAGDSCAIALPADTCALTPSASGTLPISATYGGDGNFQASASLPGTLTVLPATRTVTANAGPHGSVSPSTQFVVDGSAAHVRVTPDAGYTAQIGGTCPAGTLANNGYVTGPVAANCSVSAVFTPASTALTLTVSDFDALARYGGLQNYFVTLSNSSGVDVSGFGIQGRSSPDFDTSDAHWLCVGSESQCQPVGTGAFVDDALTVPANGNLSWLVTLRVRQDAPDDAATFAASVDGPTFASRIVQSDVDRLVLFHDGFETTFSPGAYATFDAAPTASQEWTGSAPLTILPRSPGETPINTVLTGHSADRSAWRVEQFDTAGRTWLRIERIAANGEARSSDWLPAIPGERVALRTVDNCTALSLVSGSAEVDVASDGTCAWQVTTPQDHAANALPGG